MIKWKEKKTRKRISLTLSQNLYDQITEIADNISSKRNINATINTLLIQASIDYKKYIKTTQNETITDKTQQYTDAVGI